ncbi:MAG: phosphonate C-P lyase system protein PhnH [Desulfocapsa sp.]|nr:phosphonate C-P lyase system protein PhnH [Desulfocapsa sp.]
MIADMDLEQLNRNNFRNCLEALARPGNVYQVYPYNHSVIMAMASMLLYPEVTFYQQTEGDWNMIKAITGTTEREAHEADYLFLDVPDKNILQDVKSGNQQNPEFSATLICGCQNLKSGTSVILSGPGVNGRRQTTLPAPVDFLELLAEKNRHFPLGVDLYFLSREHGICALPRTTQVDFL